MTKLDPTTAAIIARHNAQTPEWKKELMGLIKKPKLTKDETARLIELSKRQAAERKR